MLMVLLVGMRCRLKDFNIIRGNTRQLVVTVDYRTGKPTQKQWAPNHLKIKGPKFVEEDLLNFFWWKGNSQMWEGNSQMWQGNSQMWLETLGLVLFFSKESLGWFSSFASERLKIRQAKIRKNLPTTKLQGGPLVIKGIISLINCRK